MCSHFSSFCDYKKKGVETKSSKYKRKGILTYDTSFKERRKREKKYNSKQLVRHRTWLFDAAFLQQTSFEFKGIVKKWKIKVNYQTKKYCHCQLNENRFSFLWNKNLCFGKHIIILSQSLLCQFLSFRPEWKFNESWSKFSWIQIPSNIVIVLANHIVLMTTTPDG